MNGRMFSKVSSEAAPDRRRRSDTARRPRCIRPYPHPSPTSPSGRRPARGCGAARFRSSRAIGGFELGGALRHAALELGIELLELAGLAEELGEYPDLGAQHLGHDRHRDIVHGAHLVAAQPVDIGQMDGRDEDDRRLLEARMLPDHGRQLEAVELRHADVDQQDRDVRLQERMPSASLAEDALIRFLAELLQDHLVGEELGRLIVDQQDVDLIVVTSSIASP